MLKLFQCSGLLPSNKISPNSNFCSRIFCIFDICRSVFNQFQMYFLTFSHIDILSSILWHVNVVFFISRCFDFYFSIFCHSIDMMRSLFNLSILLAFSIWPLDILQSRYFVPSIFCLFDVWQLRYFFDNMRSTFCISIFCLGISKTPAPLVWLKMAAPRRLNRKIHFD